MTEDTFTRLDELQETGGPEAAIERLIATLREQKDYHRLFDALMLKTKYEMGLPLARPTSFDDVPEEKRREFEDHYINAAREVGHLQVETGNIPQGWIYLRTIREPEKVTEAIENLPTPSEPDEQTEEIINIALFEGANPVKGLQMMLESHGTCNTITALDQTLPQLGEEDRQRSAKLLVRHLYEELKETLQAEISHNLAGVPVPETVHELIAGRDWLFEDHNYHTDVSHLNSVVRFARFLEPGTAELQQAMELAEYGTKLSPQFRFENDPPFDNFFEDHLQFFAVLADKGREEGLTHFREKLESTAEDDDKQLTAYVLTDLLTRIGRLEEALELAERYLKTIEDPNGFSFAALCQQAGRMDSLREASRERGDPVGYTAALIQGGSQPVVQG